MSYDKKLIYGLISCTKGGKKHQRASGYKRGIGLYEVSRELVCLRFMKLRFLYKLSLACIQTDKHWDLDIALQKRNQLMSVTVSTTVSTIAGTTLDCPSSTASSSSSTGSLYWTQPMPAISPFASSLPYNPIHFSPSSKTWTVSKMVASPPFQRTCSSSEFGSAEASSSARPFSSVYPESILVTPAPPLS